MLALTEGGFNTEGLTAFLLGIGIIVIANGFAYALAKALSLTYGRLIAGLTVLGLAFMLYAMNYEGTGMIATIGVVEVIIGLFDVLADKVGSPVWILLDPNKSP